MQDETYTSTHCIKCSRGKGFPNQLKNLCFLFNLELDIDVDKGWFNTTTKFTVFGTKENIDKLEQMLDNIREGWEE